MSDDDVPDETDLSREELLAMWEEGTPVPLATTAPTGHVVRSIIHDNPWTTRENG